MIQPVSSENFMNSLFIAIALLFGSQAYALAAKVECQISYTASNGSTINSVESVKLEQFASKRISIGRLSLEIGLGSDTTISTGQIWPAVSIEIFDNQYLTPQAGTISADPRIPAKAAYQVTDDKESVSVSCRKLND